FSAMVRFPDGREASYDVAGDEIYVDAHILKWRPLANVLGLHTEYELGRLAGRYRDIEAERRATRTVYLLGTERPLALLSLRAPGIPHHRAAALAVAEGALALPQQRRRHVLRAGRHAAHLPARAEGGSAPRARRDLPRGAAAAAPGDQQRHDLGHLSRAAGHRLVRLRAARALVRGRAQ